MEAGKIARSSRAEVEEEYRESFDPVEVGASLREARTALRREIAEVARELRIRQVYIEAIEEGVFENLPGLAYQTGFLRAYGNYLGLDGAALADRLKTARDTTGSHDDLQVFSPVDEGHLPTRSVLLLAALAAIAVYGVWYFIANTDGDPVERVAALPDRLASLIEGKREPGIETAEPGAAEGTAPPGPAVDVPPPKPQPSARAGENAGVGGGGTTVTAITEPAAPTPEPRTEAPQPAAAPRPQSVSAAEPPAPDTPPALGIGPAGGPTVAAPTLDGSAEAVAGDLPAQSADREIGATATPADGAVAAGSVPRLVLRAVTDSWIEIAAGDGPPVYSGLLREGESYAVPEREGLKMVTGNAGGLEVLVNDREIPRLGPPGAVLRDIDLDGLRRRESG